MDSQEGGAVLLSVTTGFTVFTALLPDFADVRKSVGNADMIADVRMGETAASIAVIAVGLIASSVTQSPAPAIAAIACAGALVVMYETTLQTNPIRKATVK